MITRAKLLDGCRHETDVINNLATLLPDGAAEWRPTPGQRSTLDLTLPGGVAQAIEFAYATPIGPLLHADRQARFREVYSNLVRNLGDDDSAMGRMVSNELSTS